MDTSIRVGERSFYATDIFPQGLSRCSYFNKREADEITRYGHTLTALLSGVLSPVNEEELQFIADINTAINSDLYMVHLWKKYLNAVHKSKSFHGFSSSNGRINIDFAQSSNDMLNVELAS